MYPFPTVFSTLLENFLLFSSNSKLSSAKSFSLEESNICRLGKGYGLTVGHDTPVYNMYRKCLFGTFRN